MSDSLGDRFTNLELGDLSGSVRGWIDDAWDEICLLREGDARITELEQLAAEILATFTRTEGGHRARAGQVQIQKWHARLSPAEPWNPGG